jgi:putative holliday junction resolvase
MRVLAIDHGTVRCGAALSDPSGTLARPLPVIEPPDPREVARLVGEHGVELVVVGLPVTLGGEESAQTKLALGFAEQLEEQLEVPVETWDERFTTKLAAGSAREGAAAAEDSLAAAYLLESYLESRREQVE